MAEITPATMTDAQLDHLREAVHPTSIFGLVIARLDAAEARVRALGDALRTENMACDKIAAQRDTAEARVTALEAALTKAANRLEWCAGIIAIDKARDQAGDWADEARAALTGGRDG